MKLNNAKIVLIDFVFKVIVCVLIVFFISAVFLYRALYLIGYKDLSTIHQKFDDFIIALDSTDFQLSQEETISDISSFIKNLSLNTYYKQVAFFVIDKELSDYDLSVILGKETITYLDGTVVIVDEGKYDFNTCNNIASSISSPNAILVGRKDIAFKLKIVCNNLGMDLEYLSTDIIKLNNFEFSEFLMLYFYNIFYPIV
jgi:hypothetical protein